MNFCVTILLNTSIQLWANFLLLLILHYPQFILPRQFQPFCPKQQMVISTSFNFYIVFFSQILERAIQIQLNTSHAGVIITGIGRLNRRGRMTPPAGVAQYRHRKPPASAKDLTRVRKTICGQLPIA